MNALLLAGLMAVFAAMGYRIGWCACRDQAARKRSLRRVDLRREEETEVRHVIGTLAWGEGDAARWDFRA